MVPRNGFEPSTVRVWTVCSSQLSYLGIMVEISGIEPLTYAVQVRRSPKLSYIPICNFGAGNETRTRDPNLGKVMLYQLSYSRKILMSVVPLIGIEPITYWLQVSCSTRWAKAAYIMAGVTRLELATSCVTGRRSNQLSYTPISFMVVTIGLEPMTPCL